jgi:hypothetical protein
VIAMQMDGVKKIARFVLGIAQGGMVHLSSESALLVRKFVLWGSGLWDGGSSPRRGWLPDEAAQGLSHPWAETAPGAPPFPP